MGTYTVSTSDLRNNLADVLEAVNDDTIVIVTRRGKTERAIIDIDKLEDLLAASDPQYLKKIAQARAEARRGQLFSMEDVFGGM